MMDNEKGEQGRTTIHAQIDAKALKRVTRMYNAKASDIFNETFQNARRAGAAQITVRIGPARKQRLVTISDDGSGIKDPQILLSYGSNGWDGAITAREDAAGMGMLSLAERGCTVYSRARTESGEAGPGWRVTLTPKHFRGESPATVEPWDNAPHSHGTSIEFTVGYDERGGVGLGYIAEHQAQYLPVSVIIERDEPQPGEPPRHEVEAQAFLGNAQWAEHNDGLHIGVATRGWSEGANMNFHGQTIQGDLPVIHTMDGRQWNARVDIIDCAQLSLVLPARKELVHNSFLPVLNEHVKRAIYQAIAASTNVIVSYATWAHAKAMGIDITIPKAQLKPWTAHTGHLFGPSHRQPDGAVDEQTLRMGVELDTPVAQALQRALERNALAQHIVEGRPGLEGFEWYDRIAKITHVRIDIESGGKIRDLEAYWGTDTSVTPPIPDRAQRITMTLEVERDGTRAEPITLETDIVFAGEEGADADETLPIVTEKGEISVQEMVDLMMDGFFSPHYEEDANSPDRQRALFAQQCWATATEMLCSEDEAIAGTIELAVTREVSWLVPYGREAVIRVKNGEVGVVLGQSEKAA